VLFILLSGAPPFYEDDNFVLFEMIKKCDYSFDDEVWNTVSPEAKDLIERILVYDPEKRLNLEQIQSHPWISKTKEQSSKKNILKNMKEWNSKRKLIQ
jgi:calcium/calmodulin-dependent protein kinase I